MRVDAGKCPALDQPERLGVRILSPSCCKARSRSPVDRRESTTGFGERPWPHPVPRHASVALGPAGRPGRGLFAACLWVPPDDIGTRIDDTELRLTTIAAAFWSTPLLDFARPDQASLSPSGAPVLLHPVLVSFPAQHRPVRRPVLVDSPRHGHLFPYIPFVPTPRFSPSFSRRVLLSNPRLTPPCRVPRHTRIRPASWSLLLSFYCPFLISVL